MPLSWPGPKSRRRTRGRWPGKFTPGMASKAALVASGGTAVPLAIRGWRLAGGGSPEVTQRSRVHQGRPQQGSVVHRVQGLLAPGPVGRVDVGEGNGASAVLGPRVVVHSHSLGGHHVPCAVGQGVDQGSVGPPVLVGGVGEEDLGRFAPLCQPGQQPAGATSLRVSLGYVCEGKAGAGAPGGDP